MKVPAIKKYVNELSGLLAEVDQANATIDHMNAAGRTAEKSGERQAQLQIANQRAQVEKQRDALEREILEVTKKTDIEGARQLLLDIVVRLEAADKDFRRLRAMIADFEFGVSQGSFVDEPAEGEQAAGVTRSMYEKSLDEQRARVEARVQSASDLVPNRVVLL